MNVLRYDATRSRVLTVELERQQVVLDLESAANRLDKVDSCRGYRRNHFRDHSHAHPRQHTSFVVDHLHVLHLSRSHCSIMPVDVPILTQMYIEAFFRVDPVYGGMLLSRDIVTHLHYRCEVHPIACVYRIINPELEMNAWLTAAH